MRHKSQSRAADRALAARMPASLEQIRLMAEVEAQRLAPEMIRMLHGLALDVTIMPERLAVLEFRKSCAEAVLDRAMGKPIERKLAIVQDFGAGGTAGEVAKTLAAAQEASDFSRLCGEYVGRRPYAEWPEAVKNSVEGAEAFDVPEETGL